MFYGLRSYSANSGSGANVAIPKNAHRWAFARGETDATPLKIEAIGQTNKVFWAYLLDASSAHAGVVTQTPWRTCPPMDNNNSGVIKITNGDAVNDADGFVHFTFDLTQGQ